MWNSFARRFEQIRTLSQDTSPFLVITRQHAFWAASLFLGLALTLAIRVSSIQHPGITEWTASQPAEAASTDQPLYNIDDAGQLLRSDDGMNWMPLNGLLSRATALETTGDVLYVGTESAGLFKSTDGGATWQSISQGLGPMPNVTITAVAVDPSDVDRVVAATGYWFGTAEGHFAPMDVFASEDGGATWHSISGGPTDRTVERLSLDATDPDVVEAHLSDGTVLSLSR